MLVELLTKNECGKTVSFNVDSVKYTGELTAIKNDENKKDRRVVILDSYRFFLQNDVFVEFI